MGADNALERSGKVIDSQGVSARLTDIDSAKGLAIALVVFGHVVARQPPQGNEWYVAAKNSVYVFHMAFFMFLSGVVFFAKLRPLSTATEYFGAIKNRFVRLMPAYFLFAVVVVAGKLLAQKLGHVDNPAKGFEDLINIALYPMQSVSAFLWYLYVLFLVSVVSLGLYSIGRGSLFPLLFVGALLLVLPQVQFLALGQFSKYFFFFALGAAAIRYWTVYTEWVDKLWLPALVAMFFMLVEGIVGSGLWILVALFSIVGLHGLCRTRFGKSRWLLYLGAMTFPIYLMNTMAIGVAKAALLKLSSWDGEAFMLFFPVLLMCGLILPIVVKTFVFRRVSWLDRITS